jgi:CheY-like chemotaxis protein
MSGHADGASPVGGGGHEDGAPSRRVLVADDDEDVREMLVLFLEDEGFEVAVAKDGSEALARLMNEEYHAVVLDNRMPGLTGVEVYRALATHGRRVPVILVTAAAQVQVLAASLGIRCFLGKPFPLPALLAILERAPDRCM